MSKKLNKIVCLGGGTGLSVLLSGLKKYPLEASAIVTVFDNGGSSGKLKKEFETLPPGDLRQCLVALSGEKDLTSFFNYRFARGELRGHNLGNLLIIAAEQAAGNLEKAIDNIAKILKVKEKIIPVTLDRAEIKVILKNGQEVIGEEEIINYPITGSGVEKIFLEPKAKANPKAISAIRNADLIIIGPGKFYTSVIPILLVGGIKEAILKSPAKKVFICNLTTQAGNTDRFKAEDFLSNLEQYLGQKIIDYVIFNTGVLPASATKEMQKTFPGAEFVKYNTATLKNKKFIGADVLNKKIIKPLAGDILVRGANKRTMVLHDSDKLAKIILKLI